jgi:hypothetical protein
MCEFHLLEINACCEGCEEQAKNFNQEGVRGGNFMSSSTFFRYGHNVHNMWNETYHTFLQMVVFFIRQTSGEHRKTSNKDYKKDPFLIVTADEVSVYFVAICL